MKYDYTNFAPPDKTLKWAKRPMITIEVFGPKGSRKFSGLIDSGADCSLFNLDVAKLLGIDLSKSKPVEFTGIKGNLKGQRLENVGIKVEGFDGSVNIPVCFVDSPTVGMLLGQEGFFDKHRIKFEKDHNTFEVNPVKK